MKTGVAGLDEMLHGGIPEKSVVLLSGAIVVSQRSPEHPDAPLACETWWTTR